MTEYTKVLQSEQYEQIKTAYGDETANQYAFSEAYKNSVGNLQTYVALIGTQKGYETNSQEMQELTGLVFYVLNPMTTDENNNVIYMFDNFYTSLSETAPRYDMQTINRTERAEYIKNYVMENASIFLAGNMTNDENIDAMIEKLADYGVTSENYTEFGFEDYKNVKNISKYVLVTYTANLEYRIENMTSEETVEGIKAELTQKFASSLLATLPSDVSDALEEIGSSDLYGVLVGSIFFKMAGLLLPIIYMIMASNALIAGQVDSGSMAYILSTSTKRKTVLFTQAMFLIGSLFAMFVCTSITSVICFSIVNVATDLTYGKLLLINMGAFLVMFAMSGICFFASCWFNRSKHSMAIGGGLNMFFLVATMLGLFGSPILPSIMRMTALNAFNYVSIISLFDVVSILDGTLTFVWKWAILIALGVVGYVVGSIKFKKKDLPL